MLKRIMINGKRVPVPVPIKTLAQALLWIEETLLPQGHSVTRLTLDDRQLEEFERDQREFSSIALNENSRLEIRIDSPVELAVQTLDAIRNLASAVGVGLKPLAVDLWQARPGFRSHELDGVLSDLQLMLDMIEHVNGLVDPSIDMAPMQGISVLLHRAIVGTQMAKSNSDWKGAAKILLNRIESQLKELINESETVQLRVLSSRGSQAVSPLGAASGYRRAPTG